MTPHADGVMSMVRLAELRRLAAETTTALRVRRLRAERNAPGETRAVSFR
jgi:hypothetical protein